MDRSREREKRNGNERANKTKFAKPKIQISNAPKYQRLKCTIVYTNHVFDSKIRMKVFLVFSALHTDAHRNRDRDKERERESEKNFVLNDYRMILNLKGTKMGSYF